MLALSCLRGKRTVSRLDWRVLFITLFRSNTLRYLLVLSIEVVVHILTLNILFSFCYLAISWSDHYSTWAPPKESIRINFLIASSVLTERLAFRHVKFLLLLIVSLAHFGWDRDWIVIFWRFIHNYSIAFGFIGDTLLWEIALLNIIVVIILIYIDMYLWHFVHSLLVEYPVRKRRDARHVIQLLMISIIKSGCIF
jgi:hypothetical protein